MEFAQITAGTLGFIIMTLIIVRYFVDEESYKKMNSIIIILLLAEIFCDIIIKEDYRRQIETQKEIIQLQDKHIKVYENIKL